MVTAPMPCTVIRIDVPAVPLVQHVPRHRGNERDERRGEERVEAHRRRVDAQAGFAPYEPEPVDDRMEDLLVARVLRPASAASA